MTVFFFLRGRGAASRSAAQGVRVFEPTARPRPTATKQDNDPHAMRCVRCSPWSCFGEEMRPLHYALLRAGLPGAALERRRP